MSIKLTKFYIGLPFGLGGFEFDLSKVKEAQKQAAWSIYVELTTRITTQPLHSQEGLLREALNSLYSLFELTRTILREAGPEVAIEGTHSLGYIALNVLNKGLRPFTAKWHPLLLAHEEKRPSGVSLSEHERNWEYHKQMRQELVTLQEQMVIYAEVLAKFAGIIDSSEKQTKETN